MQPRDLVPALSTLLFLAAPLTAREGSALVYVTNPAGEEILQVETATGETTRLLTIEGSQFGDLVVGPDELLYACDPGGGLIVRLDPEAPGAYEVVYQAAPGDLLQRPQCGWFSHDGLLFVTDQVSGSGVWAIGFGELGVPLPPVNVLDASQLGDLFAGEGLTKANNGDLLIVDRRGGQVWRRPFDPTLPVETLITGLNRPIGIARRSNGDIYVTAGRELLRFDQRGAFVEACADFGSDRPRFLAFSTDDTLYAATMSRRAGKLWAVDVETCTKTEIVILRKPTWKPSVNGVAVPPTSRTISKAFVGEQLFSFNSHAYELTAGECSLTITARQVAPGLVQCLIDSTIDSDGNPVAGSPAPNLGEGGFEFVYELVAAPYCEPDQDGVFTHAISAFAERLANPRIGSCEDLRCDGSPPPVCDVIQLTSYFPANEIIEGDPRVGGTDDDFSHFFLLEAELSDADSGPRERGVFCGFLPPVGDVADPDDPGLRTFDTGSTVPVKLQLAALDGGSCLHGPFVAEASVLLSVARVRDEHGGLVFEPIDVKPPGDSNDPPLFRYDPDARQYVFDLKLETYAAGTYQIVVVFLTDNAEVQETFFGVR